MNPRYQPRHDYTPRHSERPNPAGAQLAQQVRDYLAQGGKIERLGVTPPPDYQPVLTTQQKRQVADGK